MVNTKQLEELQRKNGIVWGCLKEPLEKHGLTWANQKLLIPMRNPVRVSTDPLNKVTVEINTDTLASDPNVAWATLCDMEETLEKEFGPIEKKFLYGFRYITFNFREKV